MKPLLVIAAGGTIDAAEYDFETGSVIAFAKPAAIYVFEKAMPGAASRSGHVPDWLFGQAARQSGNLALTRFWLSGIA